MDTLASCDARISFLEQEIARFTKELHDLKVARNVRAPLVRLPDELLLRIAKHAIPDVNETKYQAGQKRLYSQTWICQRLRRIFVSAPELWRTINVSRWSSRAVQECQERAAACLLDIRAKGECELSPDEIDNLIACLRKAETFHFSIMDPDFADQFTTRNKLVDIQAPLLLYLTISHVHPARMLFAALNCPNLVSLDIEVIQHADDLPAYMPALQSLRLRHTWYTAKQIYCFLLHTQQLERVYLEHAMNNTSLDYADISGQALQLPRLANLTIHEGEACAAVLVKMFPDPSTSFKVHVEEEYGSGLYDWTSSTGQSPTAGILSRMKAIWKKQSHSRKAPVNGRLTYNAGDGDPVTVRLQAGSITYIETGGQITEADPFLATVKTLHILTPSKHFDQSLACLLADVNLQHLPALKCVVIEESWNTSPLCLNGVDSGQGVRALEAWISNRHQEGRPLQTIRFIRWSDTGRPFFDRLVASQVAHSVTWSVKQIKRDGKRRGC
jgi:hypothetical protein